MLCYWWYGKGKVGCWYVYLQLCEGMMGLLLVSLDSGPCHRSGVG
jgi:hypothetical protein